MKTDNIELNIRILKQYIIFVFMCMLLKNNFNNSFEELM